MTAIIRIFDEDWEQANYSPTPAEIYGVQSFVLSRRDDAISVWSGHPNESFSIVAFKKCKTNFSNGVPCIDILLDKERQNVINEEKEDINEAHR